MFRGGQDNFDVLAGPVPNEGTKPEDVETQIASDLAQASPGDRERAYFDLHGIPNVWSETPQLIQQNLERMDQKVQGIRYKVAFEMAEAQSSRYVRDRELRLTFLRADMFDANKAALRFARFFQAKLDLFGQEKLALNITQDDLDHDDMMLLNSGYGRFLEQPDQTGRPVAVLFFNEEQLNFNIISLLRQVYYSIMIASKNVEFQRGGVVAIVYGLGDSANCDKGSEIAWKMAKLAQVLPMRLAAIHVCYESLVWKPILSTGIASFDTFCRLRVRTHHGPQHEVATKLRGFGIAPSTFPAAHGERLLEDPNYRVRLRNQRKVERLSQSARRNAIHIPSDYDVLLGKGFSAQNHFGNKEFRQLVVSRQSVYDSAEKGSKLQIAQGIVDIVHQSSGMFLKQEDKLWIPVDNSVARTKVSAAFRTLRLDKKAKDK
ncbi:unnamed protein product [Cylindrotheca closterium]|uniref:DUF6824 domain-containing protein n=1 Tax=Cylindrotheca closterium TaxID=2856 RepID=A0AAD2CS09_9STRA|nr:unnamed protein product [Cylindrotheca closterium]